MSRRRARQIDVDGILFGLAVVTILAGGVIIVWLELRSLG